MKNYYYLIRVQFLGYRFHGWQKQPNVKTLHLMVDRTLKFILQDKPFKSLASGRTDAMVSAHEGAFELFLNHKLDDPTAFLDLFNYNLPQDIRVLSIEEVDKSFNIIHHSKVKEYLYLFAHGAKFHPFCAPIMTTILDPLNIDIMKEGAQLFVGEHFFRAYCYKPSETGQFNREILVSELVENDWITASFFPENTYLFRVRGKGFMRNQIRLMMGALIRLGRGEMDLETITASLKPGNQMLMDYIAPASGLILNKIEFE